MTRGSSRARQRALSVAGVRAVVLVVQLAWLLDAAAAGPLGPVVAAWLVLSVAVPVAVAARGQPWSWAEPVIAAVDVAAVLALTATAPLGYLAVCLLVVLVLVQVPLCWGLLPGLGVGALVLALATTRPAPALIAVREGGALVAVGTALVVTALVVRAGAARQQGFDEQGAEARALIFEHSPAGAALSDGAGVLRGVNATLARWCATTPGALVGRDLADLVHPGDAGALASALGSGPGAARGVEVRLLGADAVRWVRLLVVHLPPVAARPALCVVQVEDAGEHRATTAQLVHDANHDALTGLPNRRALTGELAALVAAPGHGGALVMIDIDGFKAVNDRLGHDAGDELLRVVAERVRSALRPGDVAGRLGGDELLVLARGVADEAAAQAVGQRVLAALVGPVSLHAGPVVLRASIGLRRVSAADHDALAVVREADAALYRAKADGGCCVRHAEPAQGRAAPARSSAGRGGHRARSPLAW